MDWLHHRRQNIHVKFGLTQNPNKAILVLKMSNQQKKSCLWFLKSHLFCISNFNQTLLCHKFCGYKIVMTWYNGSTFPYQHTVQHLVSYSETIGTLETCPPLEFFLPVAYITKWYNKWHESSISFPRNVNFFVCFLRIKYFLDILGRQRNRQYVVLLSLCWVICENT